MTNPFEITGVPTKAKAEEIARTMRVLYPRWSVSVAGRGPYSVRRSPPADDAATNAGSTGGASAGGASAGDEPSAAPPARGTGASSGGSADGATGGPAAPPPPSPSTPPSAAPTTTRNGVQGFLDFISVYESRGNYNARYGDAANRTDPAFTSMTIDEVLDWQQGRKFSACGKYQIIRATLLSLKSRLGLSGAERFDEAMQERLGLTLLKGRGLKAFLDGRTPRDLFALSVAREWAALPRVAPPNASKSVYAGDGVNQALVTIDDYVAAIDRMKATV